MGCVSGCPDERCDQQIRMSSVCPSSSNDRYRTSAIVALVHRPAPRNVDTDLHKSNGQEQQPRKCRHPVKVCTLRTRLGLRNWQCGRCTREKTACSKSITRNNRAQIETLITSMIFLSQESPELISKIEKLTALANCSSHRRKNPQDARKTKWMAAFPAQNSDVRHVEVQIMELLGSASTECGAKTESNSCPNKIGGRKVPNFPRTIDEIMRLRMYLRVSEIDDYLGILETNMYCSDHELIMPPRKRAHWKSRILEIRTSADFSVGGISSVLSTPGI
jgi:hypothetical protein